MKERILIVEDEPSIALGLENDLVLEGYEVTVVGDGNTAVERALTEEFELMILDVMLPGKSGYDVCRAVRKSKPFLPILMLTARAHEAEKVLGLNMGADDYVTKPFSPLELRARIKALLRRSSLSEDTQLTFGPFTMDFEGMEIRSGEKRLDLTLLEFRVLAALVQNQGRVISRDHLLDLVWGADVIVSDRAIDTHIANIRKKLGPAGSKFISSVRGMGYRFEE